METAAPGMKATAHKSKQLNNSSGPAALQAVISVCQVIPRQPVQVMRDASVGEALEEIRCGRWRELIGNVRTLTLRHGKDSDAVKSAKLKLPAYLFSGRVEGRVAQALNEGRFHHSGVMQLDFDGLEDPEAVRDMLATDPHCLAAWLSPSGTGTKGLCLIPQAEDEAAHKLSFEAVTSYYLNRYGLKNDNSCSNSNRLCFTSWDSELRVNSSACELDVSGTLATPQVTQAAPVIKTRSKDFPPPPVNNIHTWLMQAAWHCRLSGMTEGDTVSKLQSYDGNLRRRLQPTEATDAARKVFSTPLEGPPRPPVGELNGRPAIELPCPGRPLSDFAHDVGGMLAGAGVYSRGGLAFTVDASGQRLEAVHPQWLRTWAEGTVSLYKSSKTAAGEVLRLRHSMSLDTATALVVAPQFLEPLPAIRQFAPVRMPVTRDDGTIELLPPGFDEPSGTLTNPAGCNYQVDADPERGKLAIRGLLAEFPFADDRSRAAAVSAMLTVYARGLLPDGATIPCFLYLANAEGSGKTTLAQLAGIPYGIPTAESRPATEEEWGKQLLALVMGGARLLLLDNLKGHLNSPSLEAYLTATTYSGRVLGVSKKFTGPADAAILLTGNRLTISPDLRRRSVFIELFMKELRAEDRTFKRRLDPPAILDLQEGILAALWALVRGWDAAGRPPASQINSSLPRWSETIAGIVEWAGFGNPAVAAVIEDGGDTDTRDIARLGEIMDPGRQYTFKELGELCAVSGLFERFTGELDNEGSEGIKARRGLSGAIKPFAGRFIAPSRRFDATGKGHQRKYQLTATE